MGVIEGLDEAIAELRDMQAAAGDASPILAEIAQGAADQHREHLAAEMSRGSAMRPLTPRYAKQKAKRYPGKTILRATDATYASITANSGHDFAEAGPTDPKAAFHGDAKNPARLRDPFYVTDEFVNDAAESLADFIGPRP